MILEANRISVPEAKEHLKQSPPALLACAYDDEPKCASLPLPGALNLRELNERLTSMSKDQEIIFYCS
jgi:hypothetical protein